MDESTAKDAPADRPWRGAVEEKLPADDPIAHRDGVDVYDHEATVGGERHRIGVLRPRLHGSLAAAAPAFDAATEQWASVDDHPNVLGVVDWGDDEAGPWTATERAGERTLADAPADAESVIEIGLACCRGLAHAHSRLVTHGALTPGRVLLGEDPQIAAFGIGRLLDERGEVDALSPAYAAPEQFDPETFGEADQRTDVYRLAAVLYEALTGTTPYDATGAELIESVTGDATPVPVSERASVPDGVDDVLSRALSTEPAERHWTVTELAAALAECIDERPPGPRGEWTQSGATPAHRSLVVADGPGDAMAEHWRADVGYREVSAVPVVADGVSYFGDGESLVAADTETGQVSWTHDLPDEPSASPAVGTDYVFVPAHERLVAVDADSGERVWTFQADTIHGSPTVVAGPDGETVYVGTDERRVYAISAADGETRWSVETEGLVRSTPAYHDGVVYVGTSDGELLALEADSGDERWTVAPEWLFKAERAPTVAYGRVFVPGTDALYAVDADSGERLWTFEPDPAGAVFSPASGGGSVYVGCRNGGLYAIDAASGKREWVFDAGGTVTAPAVTDGTVFAGSTDGSVHAVDAAAGEERGEMALEAGVTTGVTIAEETLYVGTEDGDVLAATGEDRASTAAGGELGSNADADLPTAEELATPDRYRMPGGTPGRTSALGEGPTTSVMPRWTFENDSGREFSGTVALDEDTVYVGDANSLRLLALDRDSGGCEWVVDLDDEVVAPPVVGSDPVTDREFVLAVCADGTLCAVDTDTRTVEWRYEAYSIDDAPTVVGDTLFCNVDEAVVALELGTGDVVWEATVEAAQTGSPVVAHGTVFTAVGESVRGYDPVTGAERVAVETDGVASEPAVANGVVYAATDENVCYAVDAASGETTWRSELAGNGRLREPATPIAHDGTVYVGGEGHVQALDAESGDRHWTSDESDERIASLALASDVVYAASEDGTLYGLAADTGDREWFYETGVPDGRPVVADREVYLVSHGEVLALEARESDAGYDDEPPELAEWSVSKADRTRTAATADATGPAGEPSVCWSVDTGYGSCSSVAYSDGTVFAGTSESEVLGVDAATGERVWTAATERKVSTSPVVADGTVYAGDADGQLYAFDAATGARKWAFETGGGGFNDVVAAPAVAHGLVLVGSRADRFHAVDVETGEEQWAYDTHGEVAGAPVVADGTVYFGASLLTAVDLETGTKAWTFEPWGGGVHAAVAYREGVVYATDQDSNLLAVDAETGDQLWKYRDNGNLSTPTVVDETVFVGSEAATIVAVDADDGTHRWEVETDNWVESSPAVADETVYCGSGDSTLYALDAETGDERWTFAGDDEFDRAPTVVADTVFVPCEDGTLYALSDGGETTVPESTAAEGHPSADGTDTAAETDTADATDAAEESDATTDADDASGTTDESKPNDSETTTRTASGETTDGGALQVDAWSTFQGVPARTGYRGGDTPTDPAAPAWTYDSDGDVSEAPAVDGGTVYVADGSGAMCAFDVETGDRLWSADTDEGVGGGAAVVDGTVYFGSWDRKVHAVDAETGLTEWEYEPSGSGFSQVLCTPVVSEETVFVGCRDGNLYALDADTGDEQWVYEAGNEIEASPAVAGGRVFVGDTDGVFHAVDAEHGVRDWTFDPHGYTGFEVAPAVVGDTVYAPRHDGNVYALDAETGDVRWDCDCSAADSVPAVAGDTVYVGGDDSCVHAIDADSGREEWRYETESWVKSSPAFAAGTVYVGSNDGTLYALDADTGDELWTVEADDSIQSSPAVAEGAVFVGSQDGTLYALTEGGVPIESDATDTADAEAGTAEADPVSEAGWPMGRCDRRRTGTLSGAGPVDEPEPDWTFDVDSAQGIAIYDDRAYVSTKGGELHAVDLDTGQEAWSAAVDDEMTAEPAVTETAVYAGCFGETLYAFDRESGDERWTFESDGSFPKFRATPAVADGVVYAGNDDGNLYAVDADSGETVWTYETRSEIQSAPAVANGVVYVGTGGDDVVAVDTDSGEKRWEFAAGGIGGVESSPAVVDGTVYVGSSANAVYALDATTGVEQWTFDVDGDVPATPAVVGDSAGGGSSSDGATVYVGCEDGSLHAIDADSGDEEWSASADGPIRTAAAVADGVVYVGSDDGGLRAFDADTGRRLWLRESNGQIDAAPVVADGVLYATTGHGAVEALAPSSVDPGEDATADADDGSTDDDATVEAPTESTATETDASGDTESSGTDDEFVTNAGELVEDPTEPTDDELRAAILGALCDEWQTGSRDARLTLEAIEADIASVVPGATPGLLQHNVERLAEQFYVEFQPAFDTVRLRARGVKGYEELTGESVIEETALLEVLEALYEQSRQHPNAPSLNREELQDGTYLDDDELDRIVWYLSDIGKQISDVAYLDDREGYIDIYAEGSGPWWLTAELNSAGRQLYEDLS